MKKVNLVIFAVVAMAFVSCNSNSPKTDQTQDTTVKVVALKKDSVVPVIDTTKVKAKAVETKKVETKAVETKTVQPLKK